MAERLVLHPTADLVDRPVGHPRDVERIGHPAGVGEVGREPGPVGVGQVQGHNPHALAASARAARRPSSQLGGVFSPRRDRSPCAGRGRPGRWRRWWRVPAWPRGSCARRRPRARTAPTRRGSSTRGRPWSSTAAQAVSQPTPYSVCHRGNRAAELADLAGHLGAGPGGEHLAGAMPSIFSVQVFLHAPLASDSASGASLIDEPGRTAEAVQVPQMDLDPVLGFGPSPTRRTASPCVRVDSAWITRLAGTSSTRGPPAGQSQHLLRQTDTVSTARGLLVACRSHRNDAGPLARWWMSSDHGVARSPLIPEDVETAVLEAPEPKQPEDIPSER